MKNGKRILALFLILVMVVGMIPVTAGAEQTQPTTVDSGEVGIEGTNSLGNLISDAITDQTEEETEEDFSGQYSVTAVNVTDNVATVTYEAMEEAILVVAVYSEDRMQMITTGKTIVSPENTEAEVTIEGTMPEFFEVSAYLLDQQDMSPLCAAYSSPMYTQEMRQLLDSTIYDYDQELVLNLDEDETTNFAVYNPGVVIIKPLEGVNTVVSADVENGIYVIKNVDEQISSLTSGTIFTYAYQEDELLIVKVGSISFEGTTATITGVEVDIGEVFDCLKLETAGNAGNVIVDDSELSEGVTYEGLVEEKSKPATRAWEDDVILRKMSLSFKLSIFGDVGTENSVGASLSGDLNLAAYPKLEYYISWKRQHIEITADLITKLDVSFKGSMKREGLKLGHMEFPSPVGGIRFTADPKLIVEFDMTAHLNVVITNVIGFGYDSDDGVLNLCTKPEVDMEYSMEGALFIGVEFEASAKVISKDIASIGFTILDGVRITGKMTGTNHEPPPKENASKKHTCEDCLSLRFDRVREFSVWAKLIKVIKVEKTLATLNNHMFDMYWSLVSDNPGSGIGKCPNNLYRITFKVQDKAGNAVEGQEIFLKDGESLGKTGEKGTLAVYLESGDYVFQTTIGEEIIEVTRKVSNATRVVMTNNPEILAALADLEKLLMGSIEIKTHDTYVIGTFSSGVTWKLYRSGQMVIEGEGAMDHYSSFSKVPWCNYASKIKEVEIKDGVTNVGAYAFTGCTNLKKVILGDSVVNIGNYAFQYCYGLLEIRLPVDYKYQVCSFDKCNNVQKIQYTFGTNGVMPDRNDYYDSNYYVRNSLEFMCGDSLKTVIFDEGITNVGDYAFFGAEGLEKVYFAESITRIGSYSFRYSGIQKLELPESVTSIGGCAFWNSTLTNIYLPDSLESIGYEAFANCFDLTEIAIPDRMSTGVATRAFYCCTSLKQVALPVDFQWNVENIFKDCSSVESIHYTSGTTGVMPDRSSSSYYTHYYQNTLEYISRNSLKNITFDEGITHIAAYAYYGGTPVLEYVELPSTLQTIGSYAFYDTGLKHLELPEGLTTIGNYAFQSSDLTEIWFPDSIETIGSYAFANCRGLTELVIPDYLSTGVLSGAFVSCIGLKKVTLPVDYILYANGIFENCTNVEDIYYTAGDTGIMTDRNSYSTTSYPDDYKNTLEYACRNSLKSITFGEGITHIANYACYGGTPALEYVKLPSTLESIGSYAFYCSNLTSIIFTGDAPTIGNYAFYNVTATAYYPEGNTTWTDSVLQNYGGTLTWVAKDLTIQQKSVSKEEPQKKITEEATVSAIDTASKTETRVQKIIEKPAQRAIFAGEYDALELDDRIVHTARFSGLMAGEEYIMIVVLEVDTEDLLAGSNLLAILQGTAQEDGTLVFDYVQRQQADVSYVFAAGPSNQNLENAQITIPNMTTNGETQTIEPVVTYNGKVLTEEVDYIIIGQVDYSEPGDYTCYIRGVREYTGLVECNYTVKEIAVTGWNVSLSDSVAVNFYVTVGDNILDDSVVSISIDGETTLCPVKDAAFDSAIGCYRFEIPIAAAQMTQPVTVELIVEDNVIISKTYTIRQYAEYILDDSNGYDDSVKALVKALLNYGAASQDYFDYKEDNLANAGYETGAVTPIPDEIPEVDVMDELTGCGYYGASLRFYGELTVRLYFKISKNPDDFMIYQLWNKPQVHVKDGLHYVELSGICPQDLDEILYLWIIDDSGQMMIGYSPMHYIARMYHNEETSESLKTLLQALYDYHLAAKAHCEYLSAT